MDRYAREFWMAVVPSSKGTSCKQEEAQQEIAASPLFWSLDMQISASGPIMAPWLSTEKQESSTLQIEERSLASITISVAHSILFCAPRFL